MLTQYLARDMIYREKYAHFLFMLAAIADRWENVMTEDKNTWLQQQLRQAGAVKIGFADLSELPAETRQGLPRAVIIGQPLDPAVMIRIPSGPHLDYYEEMMRVDKKLADLAGFLCGLLMENGYQQYCFMGKSDENYRTAVPFKTVARLAGWGFIGKSNLLITQEYGAAIRLITVLTDLPVACNKEMVAHGCGTCTACADVCPAKTIKGQVWQPGVDRDQMMTPQLCRKKVLERGKQLQITAAACGICIAVCPYTKRYLHRALGYC